jgi:hypothetical protein
MSFQIGVITPRITASYSQNGLDYTFDGVLDDVAQHDELKEMFWAAESETSIRRIRGTRLYGVDLSMSQRYVQFLQVPAANQPKTGWYLLRRLISFTTPTPRGLEFPFTIMVFFLGTNATIQAGFKAFGPGVRRNDWAI